jgi:nicotinate-nucleotide adenylyltransferase
LSGCLLFGGSFDPIHHGHLIVARNVAEQLGVNRVLLIPAATPPHKRNHELTPADARLAMCRLAVEGDDLFDVSDWETRQAGPNYTLLTVRHFREALGAATSCYWLIGSDSLCDLWKWYEVRQLVEECTIVTAGRPGFEPGDMAELREKVGDALCKKVAQHVLATPLIHISATDIRRRVRDRLSVRYLVPAAVAEFITANHLYAAPQ